MKIQSDVVSSTYHKVAICIPTLFLYLTEVAIQKMIEVSQRMIMMSENNRGTEGAWGGMNSATKRHLELRIKTLQNAPRDPDKLMRLLKSKRRQKEEAMYIEDTERLITEIEILKVVLYLVIRNRREQEEEAS